MAAIPLKCKGCNNTLFYSYIDKAKNPPAYYYICSRCKRMFKVKDKLDKIEEQEDPSSYLIEDIP